MCHNWLDDSGRSLLCGRQGKNELLIDDFIDNAKSMITSTGLPSSKQANLILSYLEGPTKEEIKL